MTALLLLCGLWAVVELARCWHEGLFRRLPDDLPDDLGTLEAERRRRDALRKVTER